MEYYGDGQWVILPNFTATSHTKI